MVKHTQICRRIVSVCLTVLWGWHVKCQSTYFNKLKNSGINGELLQPIELFRYNRRQRVVLNAQSWNWIFVKVGVLQRLVLEP